MAFWGLYGACFGSFGLLALTGRGFGVVCFEGGDYYVIQCHSLSCFEGGDYYVIHSVFYYWRVSK